MITKDHVNAFVSRMNKFKFDFDEIESQLSEKSADERVRISFNFLQGLLELSDKVYEFLFSLEVK